MHYENIFSQRIQIYLFNIIDTIDIFYMIDQTQDNFNCIIIFWIEGAVYSVSWFPPCRILRTSRKPGLGLRADIQTH